MDTVDALTDVPFDFDEESPHRPPDDSYHQAPRVAQRSMRGATDHAKATQDPEFEREVEQIRKHLASDAANSMREQIAAGRRINELRGSSKYGERVIPRLAARLGLSAKQLHRIARRAVAFDDADIDLALSWAERTQYILSVSILDVLAPVKADEHRLMLLDRCIDQKWTVGQCKQAVRGCCPEKKPSDRASLVRIVLARALAFGDSLDNFQLVGLADEERAEVLRIFDRLSDTMLSIAAQYKEGAGEVEASETADGAVQLASALAKRRLLYGYYPVTRFGGLEAHDPSR